MKKYDSPCTLSLTFILLIERFDDVDTRYNAYLNNTTIMIDSSIIFILMIHMN